MTPFEAESQRFYSYSTSCIYDINFCYNGPKIYDRFVSHLRKYFNDNGINTTSDNEWNTGGEEVSEIRRQAIKKSKSSILVFCEMFPFSTRCLDELIIIQKCEKMGQLVRAIYFQIDPSTVQTCGGRYGEAIEGHKEKFGNHMIEKWVVALNDTKELHSRTYTNGCQFEFMKKIVEDIHGMLIRTPSNNGDCLARQKSHITESQTLLDSVSHDVGTVRRSGTRETNACRYRPNDAGLQPFFTTSCRKVPENVGRLIMGQPSTSAGSTSKIPLGPEMMDSMQYNGQSNFHYSEWNCMKKSERISKGFSTDAGSVIMRTREDVKYRMQILLAFVSEGFCKLLSVRSIFKAYMEEKVLPFCADEKISQDLVKALEKILSSFTHWSQCYENANVTLETTNADLSKFHQLQRQVEALRYESKQAGSDEKESDDLLEHLQKRKDDLEVQLPRIKGEQARALLTQKYVEQQWWDLVGGFNETLVSELGTGNFIH